MSLYVVYFLVLLFGFIFWVMNVVIRALNDMMNYDPLDPALSAIRDKEDEE